MEINVYDENNDEEYKKAIREGWIRAPDFIENIQMAIKELSPLISYDVAYSCASTLFSACLPAVRIFNALGYLPLAEIDMIIGPSGIGKTLPLKIIRREAEKLDILLPEKFTTSGIEGYFSEKWKIGEFKNLTEEEKEKAGLTKFKGSVYRHQPFGLMLMDEIGQTFREENVKDYMAGSIQEIAQFHDMHLKSTALTTAQRHPQDPYVSVLGATIPDLLPDLPETFFREGLAGRIMFHNIKPNDEPINFRINNLKMYEKATKDLKEQRKKLETLLKINRSVLDHQKKFVRENLYIIKLSKKAASEWTEHYNRAYNSWYKLYSKRPYDYSYQYILRLPELSMRQAGRNAVARCIEDIINTEPITIEEKESYPNAFDSVEISELDMKSAIERIKQSHKEINKIIAMREAYLENQKFQRKTILDLHSPEHLVEVLLTAKDHSMDIKTLFAQSKIRNKTTFKQILKNAELNNKLIIEKDKVIVNLG